METVVASLIMGTVATVVIDLWAVILGKLFKLPTTDWAMVGRWFGHLPKGRLIHKPISASSEIAYEGGIGWGLHYVIGIIYAFFYLLLVQGTADLLTATLFGVITVLVPWFVLQPGLGLGCFARLANKPNTIRVVNLSIHTLFGAALYLGWLFYILLV